MKSIIAVKPVTAVCVYFLLAALNVHAQEESTDTTKALVSPIDSLHHPLVPIPFVGSIERSPTHVIADSEINFIDYRYSGDLLYMTPGLFVRELGTPGHLNGFTIQGIDGRNISFMSDGFLLNDPLTGVFNAYLYPTEHVDHVDVITGTRAFLYGLNSTAGAINFVSKNKHAIHPYTRIRYSEAADGFSIVDGTFSQDIIHGLNLTAGAQHFTFGERFPNDNYDSWTARAKIRYNISNMLNIYASELYNKTSLGLNGGVDIIQTPKPFRYDPLQATVVTPNAFEKVTRHDVQLGAAANFFKDSTATTMLTFSHSTNFREYRDPNSSGQSIQQDHRSQWYGTKLTQHFMLNENPIDLGAEVQSRGVIASDVVGQDLRTLSSLFGKAEFALTEHILLSPYFRLDNYLSQYRTSTGIDINSHDSDIQIFLGYSKSYRFPTMQELHLPDNTYAIAHGVSTEKHRIYEGGLRFFTKTASGELTYFYHYVEGFNIFIPQQYYDPNDNSPLIKRFEGLDATINLRVAGFYGECNSQYIFSKQIIFYDPAFPKWWISGGIYFWDNLFNHHLNLKTGIRGKAFSSYYATTFDQQAQIFLGSKALKMPATGAVDFILIAHIADAYVHFIVENLLDQQYITTSFYPMPERNFRFGISWDFEN